MSYTAYNRTSFCSADPVANARTVEHLKMRLQATGARWTDIYSADSSYHETSPRHDALVRILKRKREAANG